MLIKIHKKTKKRLLLKRCNSLVSTLYLLDEFDMKILDKNNKGNQIYNIHGGKSYKIAICLSENLI
jgi:hypothetical protein